jgi:hypothetical protein
MGFKHLGYTRLSPMLCFPKELFFSLQNTLGREIVPQGDIQLDALGNLFLPETTSGRHLL